MARAGLKQLSRESNGHGDNDVADYGDDNVGEDDGGSPGGSPGGPRMGPGCIAGRFAGRSRCI